MDLAASEEPPAPKAKSKASPKVEPKVEPPAEEITPATGADILRHFISSLGADEKTPRAMAEAIRGHWGCETRHWERDQVWHEDKCLMRNANAACAMALLRVATKAVMVGVGKKSVTHAIEEAREDANLPISWIKERDLVG